MKKSSESGDSLSAPCVVTRPKTLNIRTIGTPERRQCDSEPTRRESGSDTVRSAGATLSPLGDTAEIPRGAMVPSLDRRSA